MNPKSKVDNVPTLSQILIYPIKSLDGVALTKATVLKSGALQHDREFAIFDQQGRFINGKRHAKVQLLRTLFDIDTQTVSLQIQGSEQTQVYQLIKQRTQLEAWLSDYLGFPVTIQQNSSTGFPDDTNASGPTVISTATLETVATWFPRVSQDEMRLRLRTNLEISSISPFWEDQLFAEKGVVHFQVGDVMFEGINPCQRCVVPTRNPLDGQVYPDFQKIFVAKRKETLPSWAASSPFNHFYRLSVNTRIPESEAGKVLQLGDEVKILSEQ